jgi:hypothetical protein
VNKAIPTEAQLDELRSEVRQARQKRDLYRAMMSSQDTASAERLGELTRTCISTEDELRRAELIGKPDPRAKRRSPSPKNR